MFYFDKHLRLAKNQTIVCSEHQALFVRKCAPRCFHLPARKDVCPVENWCRDVCENCSASCLLSNFSDRTLKVNLSECSPVQDCCAHRLETGCKVVLVEFLYAVRMIDLGSLCSASPLKQVSTVLNFSMLSGICVR